jgi:hypothetical protein
LGGSKFGKFKQYRNLFLIFFVSGLWHGANWTFITWGSLQGIYTIAYLVFFAKKSEEPNPNPSLSMKLQGFTTGFFSRVLIYILVALSGIAFRSYDVHMMLLYFKKVFFVWDWTLDPTNGIKGSWILFGEYFKICLPLFVLDGISYFKKERYWVYLTHPLLQAIIFSFVGFLILTRGIFGKEVIYFAF